MAKRHKTGYKGVYYRWSKTPTGRKEKVFYVAYMRDGKVVEEKAGRQHQDDMTSARANLYRAAIVEGRRPPRKEQRKRAKWTIARIWEEYKAAHGDNKSLHDDELRFTKYIEPALGKKNPEQLNPMDIERLRIKRLNHLSPQSQKHVLSLLRRLFRYAKKKEICPVPDIHFTMPKVSNEKTEDLSPEQMKRLFETLAKWPDIQIANMMKMALFTGMRRGELFRLRWDDVDFEKGFITIRAPKGGGDQVIPLNQAARDVLKAHPYDAEFIFPGKHGGQRKDVKTAIRKVAKAAKLPKGFRPLHGLRHVYASALASSGKVDLYQLQRLLTHKSAGMTQRYAHLRDEALKKAAAVVDDLFEKQTG